MSIEIKQPRRRLFHKCKFDVFMNEQPTASGGKLITKSCSKCGRSHADVILPITNVERIKNMTIEELAEFIQDMAYCSKCSYCKGLDEDSCYICEAPHNDLVNNDCVTGCIEWLKQNCK